MSRDVQGAMSTPITTKATRRDRIGIAVTQTEGEIIMTRSTKEQPPTPEPEVNHVARRERRAT